MPRRKPASSKQRKAQLQLKRAVKRGEVEPQPQLSSSQKKRGKVPSNRDRDPQHQALVASARRLQSAFVKLSPALLEESKNLAGSIPLTRPVSARVAIWSSNSGRIDVAKEEAMRREMTCVKRPKWRYDMSKTEVEKNEEGLFVKWLAKMDQIVDDWVRAAEEERSPKDEDGEQETVIEEKDSMPPSPTIFERNLEVWRQLWRVTELSQILLILLDSRCPPLHFPPSLSAYLSSTSARLILVLTKVDITGPVRAAEWERYLTATYPDVRVVMVESYVQKSRPPDHDTSRSAVQGKARYEPYIPQTFKERLVQAIKEVHAEMLEPPERVRADEEKLRKWKPRVKTQVDWEAVMTSRPTTLSQKEQTPESHPHDKKDDEGEEEREPDFLTIGFIGQPNVGKSSLLNALFGTTRVRASKTPGKTKHFQTLFWTPDIRLVDCPGLVMPDLVPLDKQVLCGILPIARMPALPLCVSYAANLLPLETIFGLTHPSTTASGEIEDKRTWREGMRKGKERKQEPWTAMDIMVAYADKKGWVTAKAGRPDVNRAGNAILRALAEGKIRWAFWPPDTDLGLVEEEASGNGIWIPTSEHGGSHADESDTEMEDDEEDEEESDAAVTGSDSEFLAEDVDDDSDDRAYIAGTGRFALLQVGDEHSDTGGDED